MSIYNATDFFRAVRENETLRAKLAPPSGTATLQEMEALAAEAGYPLTAHDLRSAYRHDWEMRWMRNRSQHTFKLVNEIPATSPER